MGHCFSKKSKKKNQKNFFFFFYFSLLGKTDMVLGKMWLFSIENGAEIRPLEMGRKSPVQCSFRGVNALSTSEFQPVQWYSFIIDTVN